MRSDQEVEEIQKGNDFSLAVVSDNSKIIIESDANYPSTPPQVTAQTTNRGLCRFNPNFYANGKVCLSILGAYEGYGGEPWSSAQGLESVLISIQSLLSDNPYANEPGFEDSERGVRATEPEAYYEKVQHETLRIVVIQKLESILQIKPDDAVSSPVNSAGHNADGGGDGESPTTNKSGRLTGNLQEDDASWDPFDSLEKHRFLWYYDSYLATIRQGAQKNDDGDEFWPMPFEDDDDENEMTGYFRYTDLEKRLIRIRKVLDIETQRWKQDDLIAVEQELDIALNLQAQSNQFDNNQKQRKTHNICVALVDENPFVWLITYFGQNASDLDGGIFRIRLHLSPQFPEEQPRVIIKPVMYHHRVSKGGVLCYFPATSELVNDHIIAIVQAIEDTSPPYDPRVIAHLEATRLFWGHEDEQRRYQRAQRKSAQDSLEHAFD